MKHSCLTNTQRVNERRSSLVTRHSSLVAHFLILSLLYLFQSCERDIVSSLDNSVDDRINTLIDSVYVKALKSSEYGWMASIGTSEGYYRFWMQFKDSNVVIMQTDNVAYESQYKGVPEASTYVFRPLQRPTLIFDTYSYLSIINDPSPAISHSDSRSYKGLNTDFEFEVERFEDGVFYMTGRFNKVKAVFKKASREEKKNVEAGLMMDLPRQIAEKMGNYYIKSGKDEIEIVLKISDERSLYTFWYDMKTEKGVEKTGYYNVELNGANDLFFPESIEIGPVSITGLNYDSIRGKYTTFSTTDPNLFIDVTDMSYSPPNFPLSHIFGDRDSDKFFTKLHCSSSLATSLPLGKGRSSVELLGKLFDTYILVLDYEFDFYFTTNSDDEGNLNTNLNIALRLINAAGLSLKEQEVVTTFPTAYYSFPLTVENNGLTFTTGNTSKMSGDAQSYYDRGLTKDLIDNLKNRTFSIEWSSHQYPENLIVDIVSQDKSFVLPLILSNN